MTVCCTACPHRLLKALPAGYLAVRYMGTADESALTAVPVLLLLQVQLPASAVEGDAAGEGSSSSVSEGQGSRASLAGKRGGRRQQRAAALGRGSVAGFSTSAGCSGGSSSSSSNDSGSSSVEGGCGLAAAEEHSSMQEYGAEPQAGPGSSTGSSTGSSSMTGAGQQLLWSPAGPGSSAAGSRGLHSSSFSSAGALGSGGAMPAGMRRHADFSFGRPGGPVVKIEVGKFKLLATGQGADSGRDDSS
jgi:hypothetical protein